MKIRDDLIEVETMRSSGPGGQHANRRNTGIRIRVQLDDLPLNEEEIAFLKKNLSPKNLTDRDEIIVENTETRSQSQNRKRAKSNLREILEEAIEKGYQNIQEEKRKGKGAGGGSSSGGSPEDIREKRKRRRRSETTDDLLEEAFEEDPETMDRYVDDRSEDSKDNDES